MEKSKSYIHKDGARIWYLPSKGKWYLHRLDGPAIEWRNGHKEWWVDNKQHRLDGQAVEYSSGFKEWRVNDKWVDSEEVESWLAKNKINLSTEEGQMAFKLRFN